MYTCLSEKLLATSGRFLLNMERISAAQEHLLLTCMAGLCVCMYVCTFSVLGRVNVPQDYTVVMMDENAVNQ